jgi:large subunit ribosomal protein L18e
MKALNPFRKKATIILERKGRASPIYRDVSYYLSQPSSRRVEVNISKLSRLSKKGNIFFVPGKVLGSGRIESKVVVGAFSFSRNARLKIEERGGEALTVEEFLARYPEGRGVTIVR